MAAPAGPGGPPPEDMQHWLNELITFTREFVYNGTPVILTTPQAYKMVMQCRQRGDTHTETALTRSMHEILQAIHEKNKRPVPAEALQVVLHEVAASMGMSVASEQGFVHAAAVAANDGRALPNAAAEMPGALTSPSMTMGALGAHPAAPPASAMQHSTLAGTADAAAAPQALKKQGSGKNSPSVASTKPKKKSQSPRTPAKARKSPLVKASMSSAAATATATAPLSMVGTGAPAAPAAAVPVSAEAATKAVDDVIGTISSDAIRMRPREALSDAEKKLVRESLPGLESLLAGNRQVMQAVFMRTQSRELIARAYSAEVAVREQRRLLEEDQYIIRPEMASYIYNLLHNSISLAKEWSLAQQSLGAPATSVLMAAGVRPVTLRDEAAGQDTPLTNMHPDAVTSDPALENFQKAVKHPLDPGSLKLPATKRRATGKGGVPGSGGQTPTSASAMLSPPSSGQQPASAAFVPAPMVLPPNMSRVEFDRLPLDMRTAILKSQQSALIRQQAIGIGASAATVAPPASGGAGANPLLIAAEQGMSTVGILSEGERRLQALEKDKWNNPLEYLMCVLDKFTASAEKAGLEPAPILQQAFWPIARRPMSGGWGVIATDAVL
ncbi:hypothetical protein LPJ61_003088 [Coemansia biformis]|uniref:Uncharacterized protein n=1 Tax=Coemansia biformis TaxID=1286918 RepID=A0A9W7YCT5_9FUNG|nr:hypothetical protein LPJ61_003088 [Coemansia biformis]